jgi:excisionase family DNA binding protein
MIATETDTAWLGVPEAAAELGVCARTVRCLIHTGRLPALRVGQRYRIARSDFRKLLSA